MNNANAPKPPEAPKFVDLGMGVPVEIRPAPAPEAPRGEECGHVLVANPAGGVRCIRCDAVNPKPAPAPEPMPCGICKGMGFYNTVYRDRIRCPNLCGDPNPILPTKAPEPKQLGPNHSDACTGGRWTYSGSGYNRVRLCVCGAEDHAPEPQGIEERGYPFDEQTARHKHIGCQTCDEKHIAYLALRAENERLKVLGIKPSTGSDLLWVEGEHRCAATISNNHLWQLEDEAESLRDQLATQEAKHKVMLEAIAAEAAAQLAEKEREIEKYVRDRVEDFNALRTERAARERAEELHKLHCANPTCLGPRS